MATSLGAPLPALFFVSVAQWLLPACELCRSPVPDLLDICHAVLPP